MHILKQRDNEFSESKFTGMRHKEVSLIDEFWILIRLWKIIAVTWYILKISISLYAFKKNISYVILSLGDYFHFCYGDIIITFKNKIQKYHLYS